MRRSVHTLRAALLLLCVAVLSLASRVDAVSPAGDVVGKITVGYQGWFATPTDGTPIGLWWHWDANESQIPSNTNSVIHAWPDMREFTNQYATGYPNLGDGQTANLFSSDDQQVVNTQFSWMAQNGIDTAALQRFNPTGGEGPERNQVTQKVMNAAQSTGVKFYIMYDTSGWGSTFDTDMENDWTNVMVGTYHVTSSPAYAMQNGKPVVCIWGFGFNDGNHPTNATQCINLINWFKSQGCYVIGGVPTYWRTEQAGGDSVSGFLNVYHTFNMLSPWMVGRIGNATDSDNFRTNVNAGDVADCNANGIDYQPCVLPGDTGQRLHGTFMWEQFYNMVGVGASGIYISMFDEFNEGNQICKTAEDSAMSPVGGVWQWNNNGTITNVPFFTLDQDGVHCSSDFYLRETGDGGKMLKGQIALTKTMPTPPVLTPAAPTNLTATAGSGQVTLTWTASDETSSYNVYRSTSSGGEGSTPVVTGITGPPSGTFPRPTITYTNTGLSNGTTYYFRVAAVNPTGTSAQSNEASAGLGGGTEGPFGGTPAAIPGTVQAENYDTGGQGTAYNATSTNGTANSYRSDGIDLETTSDTGGGYDLGWTSGGQWFRYTVNVSTAGTYNVACRVANGTTGNASFHIQNSSGANLSGAITVPATGGWQTWTTVNATVTLPAGQQVLTVWQDTGGFNINSLTFTSAGSSEGPYPGPSPAAIPGAIQAENYDTGGEGVGYHDTDATNQGGQYRTDGVDVETTSDTGGGYDVGWNYVGEWMRYTVNVAAAGTYTVTFRVSNGTTANGGFHLQNSAGTNLTGAVTVTPTVGWQTWTNVSANVTLPAGPQVLTLWDDGSNYNINYMTFASATPASPTGLSATAGNAAVTLNWTGSTGAASYNVYRGTSSGGEGGTPVATGLTGTSYTNSGLTNGTTYYYKVAAVNSAGTSGLSGEASATPTGGSSEGPYGGTPAAIPGVMQAENYDTGGQGVGYNATAGNGSGNSYRTDGIDLETTSDAGGGYDVGWTSTGQWFKYTVNVSTAGTYTVSFRVAAPGAVTDGFHLSSSAGGGTGNVDVPATGGWQTWSTVTSTMTLAAGQQVLTLSEDNGGWNINYVSFASGSGSLTPVDQIDCGSPSAVNPFSADADFSAGNEFSSTNTINLNGQSNAAPAAVYQTVRWNSSFNYTIPNLTAGATYTVRLHFCELTWTASGQRLFNVAINGNSYLSNFDVFATAGGQNKALVEQTTATANSSGQIVISFTQGGKDNPEIAGIEVLR